jgi:hypothetical protein
MFTLKNRILPTASLILMLGSLLLLPVFLTTVILTSTILIAASYYLYSSYEINYKYWLSFFGQLIGLVFFVLSFLLVFIMGASYASGL